MFVKKCELCKVGIEMSVKNWALGKFGPRHKNCQEKANKCKHNNVWTRELNDNGDIQWNCRDCGEWGFSDGWDS